MTQQPDLLDQILSGHNRRLQLLAASGLVPLAPEHLLPIQVALAFSPDAEIANKSSETLAGLEPRLLVGFLESQAGERELAYFAARSSVTEVLQTIIRRRDVPRQILVQLAERIPAELQDHLIRRQDAIIEEPEILVALERNPQLTSEAKRLLLEYREDLLREKLPPQAPEETVGEAEALDEKEIGEAVEAARETPAEGAVDESSGLSEGQVRTLPVPIRMRMARNASRQMRSILIRDTNTQVALMVLRGNQLSDQEIEQIASSRNVVDDVLLEIARKREWIRKYAVARSLVRNPRTPLAFALRLVPRMSIQDLRHLARDKNVAEGVRSTALRLYQAKR